LHASAWMYQLIGLICPDFRHNRHIFNYSVQISVFRASAAAAQERRVSSKE